MVNWDLLVQNWNDVTGWTKAGAGTSDIDPAGQLRQIPDSATYVNRWQDIGALPTTYTAEFRLKIDDFGDSGFWTHDFYDGVNRMNFQVFPTYVYNADSAQSINVTTTEGVFYTWRLVIDSAGGHIYVYRDKEYLGDLGAGLVYAPGDGTVYATAGNGAGNNFEAHEDFLLIATGLYHWVSDDENLPARFILPDWEILFAEFIVRQTDKEELFAELIVRHTDVQDLYAKFEIQDSEALYAKFAVRQEASEDLFVDLIIRNADSQDLFAKFEIQDSETLFAEFIIRQEAFVDLLGLPLISSFGEHIKGSKFWAADSTIFGSQWTITRKVQPSKIVFYHEHSGVPDNNVEATIYTVQSGKPGSPLAYTNSISLTVGFNEMDILDKPELDPGSYFILVMVSPSAGTSYGKYETTGSGTKGFTRTGDVWEDPMTGGVSRSYEFTLYAEYSLVTDATTNLAAEFIVLQGKADLFAEFGVKQWQEDLFAKFVLPERGDENLPARFILPDWEILFAKFEAQAIKNLYSKFVVRKSWYKEILGFFTVNLYTEDLYARFEVRTEDSVEVFAQAILRRSDQNDLPAFFNSAPYREELIFAKFVVRQTATPREIYAKFEIQDTAELKCVIQWISQTGTIPPVTPIIGDYIAQWLNYTRGDHRGFISEPVIKDDFDVKAEGVNSCSVESVYEAHTFKEVTFGWGWIPITDSAGNIIDWRPVQSPEDRAGYLRRSSSNSVLARFYVMSNQLPDYELEWWAETFFGLYGQFEANEENEITLRGQLPDVGAAYVMAGHWKAFTSGTFAFDMEPGWTNNDLPGVGDPGVAPMLAGLGDGRINILTASYVGLIAFWWSPYSDQWEFRTSRCTGKDTYETETTDLTAVHAAEDFSQRHTYQIVWEVGRVRFYVDNVLKADHTLGVPTNYLQPMVGLFMEGSGAGTYPSTLDQTVKGYDFQE